MYYALCAASMEYPFQLRDISKFCLETMFAQINDGMYIEEADLKFILRGIHCLFMFYDNNSESTISTLECLVTRLMPLNVSYPVEDGKSVISSIWNHAVEFYYKDMKSECKNWIELALSMQDLILKNAFPHQKEMMKKALSELRVIRT
jgi:hypothetical protein